MSDRDARHVLGTRGERAVAHHLRRQKYRIIARNYRGFTGEIDLITTQNETIVFVEVKSRTQEAGTDADHTVRPDQRWRMAQAARYFLRKAGAENRPCRFDVATVYFPPRGRPVIEHFVDAFRLSVRSKSPLPHGRGSENSGVRPGFRMHS